MHLQRKLEVNKLPDVEIKIITKNGILTDLTIGEKKFHTQYGLQVTILRLKLMFKEQKKTVSRQAVSW